MMLAVTTVSAVTFHDWMRKTAEGKHPEDTSDEKIAARINPKERVTQNTVRGWKFEPPAARYVIAFSRVYKVPLSEVLVKAYSESYNLTLDELNVPVSMDPHAMPTDELALRAVQMVEELGRRLNEADNDAPPWSEHLTREHEDRKQQARKK